MAEAKSAGERQWQKRRARESDNGRSEERGRAAMAEAESAGEQRRQKRRVRESSACVGFRVRFRRPQHGGQRSDCARAKRSAARGQRTTFHQSRT